MNTETKNVVVIPHPQAGKAVVKTSGKKPAAKKASSRRLDSLLDLRSKKPMTKAEGKKSSKSATKVKTKKSFDAEVKAVSKTDDKPKRETVSSVAETMILAGKTNEQVLDALVEKFDLDVATKKHYPGWFRARLVRAGKITKKDAATTRH